MRTILQLALLLLSTIAFSQEPLYNWVTGMGSSAEDVGYSIVTDEARNIYTTGFFRNTVDFDPGPGVHNLVSSGSSDIFIQKLNPDGNLIWALSIGGSDSESGEHIRFDDHYIYISGRFSDTVDFNPGPDTFFLNGADHFEGFILKLDTSGAFIWAASFHGSHPSAPTKMLFDGAHNITTLGYFTGTVDFDPGPATYELTAAGTQHHWDIFVHKMDSAGNFIWAKSIGGPHENWPGGLVLDQEGHIIINGSFQETTDFDPGTGVYTLTSVGMRDYFVERLNPMGEFEWVLQFGSSTDDMGNALSIDPEGNIYSSGIFYNTVDFDPGPNAYNLTSHGQYDVFIQKLTLGGAFIWAKSFGGIYSDVIHETAVNQYGEIYSIGHYLDVVDFDPGTEVYDITSNGVWDFYVQKLDSSGGFSWAKSYGGTGMDEGRSIYLDTFKGVYLTGYFEDTVDFDPSAQNSVLVSAGEEDIFVLKLDTCRTSYGTINPTTCDIFVSPSGNHVWDSTGIFFDTIQNAMACDSIITVNLSVLSIDTSVIQNGHTLTANDTNCQYQWADCNNGYTHMIGDTNQIFTATINGLYAVILSNAMCSDTSGCHGIYSVNTPTDKSEPEITVFAVPGTKTISIDLGRVAVNTHVKVTNIHGNTLLVKQIQNTRFSKIDLDQASVVYLVCLDLEGRNYTFKVILH